MNEIKPPDTFRLLLVQYYKETIHEEIIEGDKESLNSPYSNIRAMAQKRLTRVYKVEEFASDPCERTQENQITQAFILYSEDKYQTSTVFVDKLMILITRLINEFKEHDKIRKKPIFYWKQPFIFRIEYGNNLQDIIECTFPFSKKNQIQFQENLERVYSEQFNLQFYNENENNANPSRDGIITVNWNNVEFLQKKVCVKIGEEYHSIPCEASSSHLQELKQVLFKKSYFGLKVDINQSSYHIINKEAFSNVIKFLDVQYQFTNQTLSIPEFNICLQRLKELRQIITSYFPKDEYINKLIDYHCIDYPIIPVIEINNYQDEPSYIFTSRKKGNLYLIWENKSNGRATYIFSTSKNDYTKNCQILFDFISADLKSKRKGIRHYEKEFLLNGKQLNLKKKIVHNNYNSWSSNLMMCLEFGK